MEHKNIPEGQPDTGAAPGLSIPAAPPNLGKSRRKTIGVNCSPNRGEGPPVGNKFPREGEALAGGSGVWSGVGSGVGVFLFP